MGAKGAKNTGAKPKGARDNLNGWPRRLQQSGTLRSEVTLGGRLPLCDAPMEVTEGGTPRTRDPPGTPEAVDTWPDALRASAAAKAAMARVRISEVYT